MDKLDTLKELFEPVFKEEKVKLYDISWQQDKKNKILQVAIMDDNGKMDIETCANVSEKLSEILDANNDLINFEYYLEVCSPGAEREIRSVDELKTLKGEHVYINLKHPINKSLEYIGDVEEINDNDFILKYKDKAVTKKINIEYENISKMRLAVKL